MRPQSTHTPLRIFTVLCVYTCEQSYTRAYIYIYIKRSHTNRTGHTQIDTIPHPETHRSTRSQTISNCKVVYRNKYKRLHVSARRTCADIANVGTDKSLTKRHTCTGTRTQILTEREWNTDKNPKTITARLTYQKRGHDGFIERKHRN